jgi:hypothetical protein
MSIQAQSVDLISQVTWSAITVGFGFLAGVVLGIVIGVHLATGRRGAAPSSASSAPAVGPVVAREIVREYVREVPASGGPVSQLPAGQHGTARAETGR